MNIFLRWLPLFFIFAKKFSLENYQNYQNKKENDPFSFLVFISTI